MRRNGVIDMTMAGSSVSSVIMTTICMGVLSSLAVVGIYFGNRRGQIGNLPHQAAMKRLSISGSGRIANPPQVNNLPHIRSGEQQGLVFDAHEVQGGLRVQRKFFYDFHAIRTGFGDAAFFQQEHTASEECQHHNYGCHPQASVLKSVMRTPMMLSMITISPKAARREPM
jgi:hypothetical protein